MTTTSDSERDRASDGDRLRWQREAIRVLSDLLAAGAAADLPAIHWTIGPSGALVGECLLGGPSGNSADAREHAFNGWRYQVTRIADAVPDDEGRTAGRDQDRLRAAWKQTRTSVLLTAALWHDDDVADIDPEDRR